MSNREPENNNLIKFIAETIEMMRNRMATKDDFEKMATKSDVDSLGKEFESLSGEVSYIAGQVEIMRDQMATKSDLAQLEDRLTTKLEVQITAVRGDIEQVNLRLDPIERSMRGRMDQIETKRAGCVVFSICS